MGIALKYNIINFFVHIDQGKAKDAKKSGQRIAHTPKKTSRESPISRADLIQKKARIASKVLSKTCRNLRRDGVDEKCVREGIKYYKWKGTKGRGRHISHEPSSKVLIDYIPRGQKINEDCVLCPKEIRPSSKIELLAHVRRVHVAHLITLRDMNLLMCRCSDVCSQGRDNSVRNRHWHCIDCWQPCTTPAKLKTHILNKHKNEYRDPELAHLNTS